MVRDKEVLRRSAQLKKKKRIGRWVIILAVLFSLWLIATILCFLPQLQIKEIVVRGNKSVTDEQIRSSVEKVIAGRWGYIYPRRSFFLYPAEAIVSSLHNNFPRLEEIEVGAPTKNSLLVDLRERTSDLIWCRRGSTDRDCFFADPDGLLFAPAPAFSSSVFIEIYSDLPAQVINARPLDKEQYWLLTSVLKNVSAAFTKAGLNSLKIDKVDVLTGGDYQIFVGQMVTGNYHNWSLFFNLDLPPEKFLNNLVLILQTTEFKKTYEADPARLDYIDMRYGKKVFYRFR